MGAWSIIEPLSEVTTTFDVLPGVIEEPLVRDEGELYTRRGTRPYVEHGPVRSMGLVTPDWVCEGIETWEILKAIYVMGLPVEVTSDAGDTYTVQIVGFAPRLQDTPNRNIEPIRHITVTMTGVGD